MEEIKIIHASLVNDFMVKKTRARMLSRSEDFITKTVVTYVVTWNQIKLRYDLMKMVKTKIKIP